MEFRDCKMDNYRSRVLCKAYRNEWWRFCVWNFKPVRQRPCNVHILFTIYEIISIPTLESVQLKKLQKSSADKDLQINEWEGGDFR